MLPKCKRLKGKGSAAAAAYARHLLILGDGFTAGQLTASKTGLEARAKAVATAITKSPWYPGKQKLWIWLAYSESDPAVDPPLICQASCTPPPGDKPPSRFHSKYGAGTDCRMLSGDSGIVHNLVMDLQDAGVLPNIKSTLVLVNYPVYGGWGLGEIAWSSVEPKLVVALAVHELAHSFGLYDEYENPCGHADTAKASMHAPNVSSNKTSPMWRYLQPGAWEVAKKASKTDCALAAPIPNVKIGAFPGGYYSHAKYYRPAERCRMRSLEDPFCEVCVEMIKLQV